MVLIGMRDVSWAFDDPPLLEGISFQIERGSGSACWSATVRVNPRCFGFWVARFSRTRARSGGKAASVWPPWRRMCPRGMMGAYLI